MRSWVDTHVWRISIRLGLIGKKLTADDAHNLLQALLPQDARTIYNFHEGVCCGMVNISASMTDRTGRSVS